MTKILITGANGHLGRRLIRTLNPDQDITALVRSERARDRLARDATSNLNLNIVVGDPSDPDTYRQFATDCQQVVHLIGTIKASRNNPLEDSHQKPIAALLEAAPNCAFDHLTYISILGANADASSVCLRARFDVEQTLARGPLPATIIRVPMVLGEGDRASFALKRRASSRYALTFRASSLEQPIYAGDVIDSLLRCVELSPDNRLFELAGPESVTRRDLIARAGHALGSRPRVVSLPLWMGIAAAGFSALINANPRVTKDMLRILDHDDDIDPHDACEQLGITLTSLDEMLRRCVREANR